MNVSTSIYINKELDDLIDGMVRDGLFASKSQLYTEAVKWYLQALAQVEEE